MIDSVQPLPGTDGGMEEQLLTLVFCRKLNSGSKKILLGLKKTGFGIGRWNGFGGKVEKGETIDEGARRELLEECCIAAITMKKRAILTFHLPSYAYIMKVHVFEVTEWTGEPMETSEMMPKWYDETDLPYDSMWVDDRYWLPLFLHKKTFIGHFKFLDDNTIEEFSITEQSLDTFDDNIYL